MASFTNPANGHVEQVGMSTTVLAFFFGVLYFAVKGIWRHVFIQLVLIVFFFATLGPPGAMLALLMWIGYAIGAQSIVSADYLRKGWKGAEGPNNLLDISERPEPSWMTGRPLPGPGAAKATTKNCPFCAETVLLAAIKCKHCGSELPASAAPEGPGDQMLDEEARRLGITWSPTVERFVWRGSFYKDLNDAKRTARAAD